MNLLASRQLGPLKPTVWMLVVPLGLTITSMVMRHLRRAGSGASLRNPTHDADALAGALQPLGFTVIKKKDLDRQAMEDALVEFYRSLGDGALALVFYAGHGVQVKGENYLVPVGARLREEFEVPRECLSVNEVLRALGEAPSRLNVIILDCCRNNPYKRAWRRSNLPKGLAAIGEVPQGTLIAYSTAPGQEADDGREHDRGSPYARELVRVLSSRPQEGLELVEASRAVKQSVGQTPWLNLEASLPKFHLWRPDGAGDAPALAMTLPVRPPTAGARPAPEPDSAAKVITNSIGMKLVMIPAGEFMMGGGEPAERIVADFKRQYDLDLKTEYYYPQHRVRISRPFYLGQYEVTFGQFLQFYHDAKYKTEAERDGKGGWGYTGETGKGFPFKQSPEYVAWNTGWPQTNDHPVVNVSWNDAVAFCEWLSRKEGVEYRLPTEAEWEYACRAGTTTRYYHGDDPEGLAEVGNVADATAREKLEITSWTYMRARDGFAFTAPVGRFHPNAFGLYDMHGNVLEWCADWYDESYYAHSPSVDPKVPLTGGKRVLRGGSWLYGPFSVRSAFRYRDAPEDRYYFIGFRLARTK